MVKSYTTETDLYRANSHGGILNVVPSVSSLNNTVDVSVELEEVGNVAINSLSGCSIGVEVGGLSEEVGTKTLVRVVEDSVLVGVSSGGSVLAVEFNLPDASSALLSLAGGSLLGLGVVALDHLGVVSWVNSDDREAGSESVALEGVSVVEKVMEGGDWKVGVLGGDAGDVHCGHGNGSGESLHVVSLVGLDSAHAVFKSGSRDEGHDVGVVGESEDSLVGGGDIVRCGSDSDDLAGSKVGELELQGKGVP